MCLQGIILTYLFLVFSIIIIIIYLLINFNKISLII